MSAIHNILDNIARAKWVLPDPGSGNALRVSKWAFIEISTSAAETNTLPDPPKEGILLVLSMIQDGGDRVITASSAINSSGNTVITLNDVGDTVVLLSRKVSSTAYAWMVVANNGASLS